MRLVRLSLSRLICGADGSDLITSDARCCNYTVGWNGARPNVVPHCVSLTSKFACTLALGTQPFAAPVIRSSYSDFEGPKSAKTYARCIS